MWWIFLIIIISCVPQKPNALIPKAPVTEFDKRDGRVKARDKFDNKERLEYYNAIQHK
jgi:hypothetical protein